MSNLILASGSPRRKELLKELGYTFEIIPSNINEEINLNNPIEDELMKLSFNKASSVFNSNKDSIVIGADTIVYKNNKVYGKPKNKDEAYNMIKDLNNTDHEVITAVSIISKEKSESFYTKTIVTFDYINDEEIKNYINKNDVLDKAGAYAIQGDAKKFIKSINGDYYSVMGLPICELNKRLRKYYE